MTRVFIFNNTLVVLYNDQGNNIVSVFLLIIYNTKSNMLYTLNNISSSLLIVFVDWSVGKFILQNLQLKSICSVFLIIYVF